MKKVVEFLKRNLIGIIIGGVLFGSIGIAIATSINSDTILYSNETNEDITNVYEALNDLYRKAKNRNLEEGTTINFNNEVTEGVFSYGSSYNLAIITLDENISVDNTNITINNNVMDIDYIGSENIVKINTTGYYKLEVWGAQGGGYNSTYYGGYGGYSTGIINLTKDETLYINVGGSGKGISNSYSSGGYNGGGDGYANSTNYNRNAGSGGGATHIATVTKSNESGKTGELKYLEEYKGTLNTNEDYYISEEILIVASGGGGIAYTNYSGYYDYCIGGCGGGIIGGIGECETNRPYIRNPNGGTQITAGTYGYHYVGSTAMSEEKATFGTAGVYGQISNMLAGGGGGFFGGGSSDFNYGAGGSGYIASSRLISGGSVTKHMAAYGATGDYLSNDTETKTIAATNVSATATADYAKSGNGYARITYCGASASDCE